MPDCCCPLLAMNKESLGSVLGTEAVSLGCQRIPFAALMAFLSHVLCYADAATMF